MSNINQINHPETVRELSAIHADENELRMYARMTRELDEAMEARNVRSVRECLDELDLLAQYTSNPNMRRMCEAYQIAA